MRMRFSWKWLIPLLLVITAGAGWKWYDITFDRSPVLTMSQEVITAVERGDIQVQISGTGSVVPRSERVTVVHEGTVNALYFTEGDHVLNEQTLLVYEQDDKTDQVAQLQLNLERKLLELEEAQRNLAEREDELLISAPASGHLLQLSVEQGDHVQPGQQIGVIHDVDVKYVKASFYSTQIERIKPG